MPVVKRPEFLGWLTAERETIAIAGTHGKTTTTAMIAWVLVKAGRDPSYIVGGTLPQLQRNARAGKGPHFVIEADEYDRTFLGLCPTIGVVTTVEWDHVDCYPTPKDCVDAFHDFAALIPEDGLLVACAEDPIAAGIGETRKARGAPVTSYGLATGVDWQARRVRANGLGGSDYAAWRGGRSQGTVSLRIPGRHNVLNSLAALAVAEELGISFDVAAGALSEVSGVERRFQEKGTSWAITVVDDYAHHPTEIRATLSAARQRYPGRAIWAVFQPHTYSRTRALLEEFAVSFVDADHVIVTDIFAAREQDSLGTSAAEVANRMTHNDVQHIGGLKEAAVTLLERMRPGDVLITLGAGDGYRVGEWVLAGLRARRDDQSAASGTA
jgi:UDP-N-acetylmuramate--alanine ligase